MAPPRQFARPSYKLSGLFVWVRRRSPINEGPRFESKPAHQFSIALFPFHFSPTL